MLVALTAALTGDEEESSLEEEEGRDEGQEGEGEEGEQGEDGRGRGEGERGEEDNLEDDAGDEGLEDGGRTWMGVRIRMVRQGEEGGRETEVQWRGRVRGAERMRMREV